MNPNLTTPQIIPATAGTNLLIADADALAFCAVPVIAWSCTPPREGHAARAEPVTLAGDDAELDTHAWAVRHHHGVVEIPGAGIYPNADAWLADLRACAAA
ncbi:hypothetical protein [uncultured Sphaerotilus sp.]|uniref:hypothetical protein n=1 Tax=uncultured Sphaerotilus sp. TaxID=474984 RepID=UPI0030CA1FB4